MLEIMTIPKPWRNVLFEEVKRHIIIEWKFSIERLLKLCVVLDQFRMDFLHTSPLVSAERIQSNRLWSFVKLYLHTFFCELNLWLLNANTAA